LAYNPSNGFVYVTNADSNTVSVIDGSDNTVVDTITIESQPWGLAYNPSNGYMFVTNYGLGTVSIIGETKPNVPPSVGDILEGSVGSGNNINIQVQENCGNNAGGQASGDGEMYSDSPIFQEQSTKQDSSVVS